MRVYTDHAGFVVSLKDSLDPCKFGIFSDESGFVYEKAPLSAPFIAQALGGPPASIEAAVLAQPHDRAGDDPDVMPIRTVPHQPALYLDER